MAKGPVKHVVLFKFKDHVDEKQAAELIEGYKALPGKIAAMKAFEWGPDVSTEGLQEGFTHCFITTFENTEGRDSYIPHQAHKDYVEVLFPHLDKILVLDYVPQVVM